MLILLTYLFILKASVGAIELIYEDYTQKVIYRNSTTTIGFMGNYSQLEMIESIDIILNIDGNFVSIAQKKFSPPTSYRSSSSLIKSISRSYLRASTELFGEENGYSYVEFTSTKRWYYEYRENVQIKKLNTTWRQSMKCPNAILVETGKSISFSCILEGVDYNVSEHEILISENIQYNLYSDNIVKKYEATFSSEINITLTLMGKNLSKTAFIKLINKATRDTIVSDNILLVVKEDLKAYISLSLETTFDFVTMGIYMCSLCKLKLDFEISFTRLLHSGKEYTMPPDEEKNTAKVCVADFGSIQDPWKCSLYLPEYETFLTSDHIYAPTYPIAPENSKLEVTICNFELGQQNPVNRIGLCLASSSASFGRVLLTEFKNYATNETFVSTTNVGVFDDSSIQLTGSWSCNLYNEYGVSQTNSVFNFGIDEILSPDEPYGDTKYYFVIAMPLTALLCLIFITLILYKARKTVGSSRQSNSEIKLEACPPKITELTNLLEIYSASSDFTTQMLKNQINIIVKMILALPNSKTGINLQLDSILNLLSKLYPQLVQKKSNRKPDYSMVEYFRIHKIVEKITKIFNFKHTKFDSSILHKDQSRFPNEDEPTKMYVLNYRIKSLKLFTYLYGLIKSMHFKLGQAAQYKVVKKRYFKQKEKVNHIKIEIMKLGQIYENIKSEENSYLWKNEHTAYVTIKRSLVGDLVREGTPGIEHPLDIYNTFVPERLFMGGITVARGDPTRAVYSLIKNEHIKLQYSPIIERVEAVFVNGTKNEIDTTLYVEEINSDINEININNTVSSIAMKLTSSRNDSIVLDMEKFNRYNL